MRNLPILMSRELRAMVMAPIFWVILVAFLVFSGGSFVTLLHFLSQSMGLEGAPMQFFFGGTLLFWLGVFPVCAVLPMGTFAAERRNGTIETLMTAPVSDLEVVMAKYLSTWVVFAALWAPSWIYVLVLRQYGDPEMGPIAAGFIGTMLVGAMFLSIGVLVSALTRSQIIAAIVTFAAECVMLLSGLLEYVTLEGLWHDIFHFLNIWEHMSDWGRGIVDTRYLVYYATVTLLCLFSAVRAVETRRWR